MRDLEVPMHVITDETQPIDIWAASADFSSRQELLARYRHFRAISKQHHSAVIKLLTKDAIMSQAKRLRLTRGKTLVVGSMDELNLAFDLAIYTAPKERTRAIDRFARVAPQAPGSDEAVMLEAMRQAHFAVIMCNGRHPVAGLVMQDVFRKVEYRLIDEGLESSFPEGAMLATRLYALDGFVMTAGVGVPCDSELIADAYCDTPPLHRMNAAEIIDDRRFAEALFRLAIKDELMENLTFEDPVSLRA
jgi:hypothetical protein